MNRTMNKMFSAITILALMLMALPMPSAGADNTTQSLPYSQDWSNTGLITTSDDWSGVPGVIGYRGDGLTSANDVDPQTVLSQENPLVIDVNANQTNPNTFATGGVAEFHLANSAIALTGSGTADAPYVIFYIDSTGFSAINVSYNLRDLDASTDNAAQQVALQFRIGDTGNFTNVPTGYVADATTGPSLATLVTPVSVTLPAAADNQAQLQIRVITTNASGNDEWVGIDDVSITGTPIAADTAPSISGTTPANGATNVALDTNINIDFSEPVTVNGSWFTISCASSGAHTAVVSGGTQNYVLDPDENFAFSELCSVSVTAASVVDQDGTPDNMTADYNFSFTTVEPPFVCGDSETLIHDIQGTGLMSPSNGATGVSIEGVVIGDFQGSGGLGGYYVQEEDAEADADPSTSEGIFVFNTSFAVNVGDTVRVKGNVVEFETPASSGLFMTELTNVSNVLVCSTGNSVTSTEVTLPVSAITDFERFEGMLVNLPQGLVISEYFNYERFGEMVLALPLDGETRAFTPTSIDEPGAAAQARALANSLRRITLDDGLGIQNPSAVRHPNGGSFALNNRFRGGDTVQNTVGVMDFSFGLYRIQPTGPADYAAVNPRTAAPEAVGGDLRVAAMNTLNFFLTLDTTTSDTGPGPCGGNQNLDCRGADSNQPTEFTRQRDKLLAALAGLNGDVIGLNELENTPGVDPLGDPNKGIVVGLNSMLGAGTYAYIDTGVIGTDAIRVGLIYKPANVIPVGSFKILDSTVDPRFIDTRSRPALAQTFEEVATGARFTVVVNHLKSKGSACTGDPDTGDGQGNCNQTRRAAAQALVDWIATDPTGSGDADYIIMGDLNSYAQEDPIDAIKAGSDDSVGTYDDYTNLIFQYQGTYAYSYVFDGQAGYLDHALSFPSLTAQVTGAADWHINSDEPDLLDYDTSFKPPAQDAIYEPNAYRSSDHDPVIVGLDLLHYNFSGFFHPIDNAPTVNSVKAGQAVPIKFSLDGDQGLDIFLDGYPRFEFGSCEPSSTDPVEETLPSSNSGLTYDPATDQYTYVWKTERNWSGKCGTLTLVFDDGSIHNILFKFTK